MITHFCRKSRLLSALVAAWSVLLGASHALHAVYHLTLAGTASAAADHSCTLCAVEREPLLPTPEELEVSPAPQPDLLPLHGPGVPAAPAPLDSRDGLSPCAGRAPPILSLS
jgi:hypothetical protein